MSLEREFVKITLAVQYEIALKARAIQNVERILFWKEFEEVGTIMVGNVRVSLDRNGNQAILSSAAQQLFNKMKYLEYNGSFKDVVLEGDKVLLKKL